MSSALGRRLLLWGPPAVYMYVIFFMSSEPDPMPALTRVIWDKALHGAGYAGLAALVARAFAGEGWSSGRAWLAGTLAASLYGVSDEFHQSFVAGRDSEALDWVADTVGAVIGAAGFLGFLRIWRERLVRRWPALAKLNWLVGTR